MTDELRPLAYGETGGQMQLVPSRMNPLRQVGRDHRTTMRVAMNAPMILSNAIEGSQRCDRALPSAG